MNKKTNIFDKLDDWIRIDFKFQDYIKLITGRKLRNWRKLDFLGNRAKWKHIYIRVYMYACHLLSSVFYGIMYSCQFCYRSSIVSSNHRFQRGVEIFLFVKYKYKSEKCILEKQREISLWRRSIIFFLLLIIS